MRKDYKVPTILENPLILNKLVSTGIKDLIQFAGLTNVKIHDESSNPFEVPQTLNTDGARGISSIGTLVYSSILFNSGKVFDSNGALQYTWDDFEIQDCLLQVSQSKKIIVTEIQGRDGTVKEYIGMDDFQVQIIGRLNGDYGVNPKEDTATLKKILDAGQPLAVTSWWLQNLGITDIVVKDFNFAQTEGEYSTQYFSINAISDKVVESKITGQ